MPTSSSTDALVLFCQASHNIMDALFLRPLLRTYGRLRRSMRPDVLCVQESVPHATECMATALLGRRRFAIAADPAAPRLAMVYDRTRLRLQRLSLWPLPLLDAVPLWQRVYISGIDAKQALVGQFVCRHHRWRRITIANFHLDAAGDNQHRGAQLRTVAAAIGDDRPVVACGDTNAFTWVRSEAEPALRRMLAPLAGMDAHAHTPKDTHFFARAREPKLGHRIAVAFGRLGVDFPRRYDVIVSSLPAERAGQVSTPESDHDLVWALVGVRGARRTDATTGGRDEHASTATTMRRRRRRPRASGGACRGGRGGSWAARRANRCEGVRLSDGSEWSRNDDAQK